MTIQKLDSGSDDESSYNSQNHQTEDWEYIIQWLNIEFDSHLLLLYEWDSIWVSEYCFCWKRERDKYDK